MIFTDGQGAEFSLPSSKNSENQVRRLL